MILMKGIIGMPTKMLVLIIIALILLVLGLAALAQAGVLTVPVFEEIAKLIGGLTVAE